MNKNQGFTLIELLVVVLIIGILAAVALPQYQTAVDKAHYADVMAVTKHIKNAQELYYMANGEYASSCEELGGDTPAGATVSDNKIMLPNKNYVICWHGGSSGTGGERVAGIVVEAQDHSKLFNSYEIILDNSSVPAEAWRIACWAKTDSRAHKVCRSLGGQKIINDNFYRLE